MKVAFLAIMFIVVVYPFLNNVILDTKRKDGH